MDPETKKPWWSNPEGKLPEQDIPVHLFDDIMDTSDPDKPTPMLCWMIARAFFSTGPCLLQTKSGKDVRVMSYILTYVKNFRCPAG